MAVVRTSDDARDMFTDFAEATGCSVSALLEAIARRLPPPERASLPGAQYAEIVEEARAIDAERRRRG